MGWLEKIDSEANKEADFSKEDLKSVKSLPEAPRPI
jgi:hypothetical protein